MHNIELLNTLYVNIDTLYDDITSSIQPPKGEE